MSHPTIGADGTIYVGSLDNKLYAINPDGSLKWSYTTGHDVRSSPAIGADGTVYVGSDDKKLYAFGP
jgi:outer membrane protein assembly factor BamB